jgi:IclR helix-turn-helix domain
LTEASNPPPARDNFFEVKNRDQWVCWSYEKGKKGGKPKKPPTHPTSGYKINYLDPSNWMSYEEAVMYSDASSFLEGTGVVLTEDDEFCGIDIDERVDVETGEMPPWIPNLLEEVPSYAYLTPNLGVRIMVKGRLYDTGGDYLWTDPTTGEEHAFEVYDRDRYFTFTDFVYNDCPIKEAQDFLDSLTRRPTKKSTHRTKKDPPGDGPEAGHPDFDVPEVDLPEDLEEARKKFKLLLMKHDLPPYPIVEGHRKKSLISYFRKMVRGGAIQFEEDPNPDSEPDDELWYMINVANATMLYSEVGSPSPLDSGEIREVYATVTKDLLPYLANKPSRDAQNSLDELREFLTLIRPQVNYTQDSVWKVLKAFEKHGRKYGSTAPGGERELRVPIGWVALQKESKLGSTSTLSRALSRLTANQMISKGRHKGDRTNFYDIDLEKVTDLSLWGVDAQSFYAKLYKCEHTHHHHSCTPLHKRTPRDVLEDLLEDRDTHDAIVHTTWYRHGGPSRIKYLLAFCMLGGEATNTEVAEVLGVKPTSTSRLLKKMKQEGLLHQDKPRRPYRISEDVPENLYRFRSESGEFDRDARAKRDARNRRRCYTYQMKLQQQIVGFIQIENMSSREAQFRAVEETSPPSGIDEYDLFRYQEWALRGAEREVQYQQSHKGTG